MSISILKQNEINDIYSSRSKRDCRQEQKQQLEGSIISFWSNSALEIDLLNNDFEDEVEFRMPPKHILNSPLIKPISLNSGNIPAFMLPPPALKV